MATLYPQYTLNVSYLDKNQDKRTLNVGYVAQATSTNSPIASQYNKAVFNTFAKKLIALTKGTFIESYLTLKNSINVNVDYFHAKLVGNSFPITSDNSEYTAGVDALIAANSLDEDQIEGDNLLIQFSTAEGGTSPIETTEDWMGTPLIGITLGAQGANSNGALINTLTQNNVTSLDVYITTLTNRYSLIFKPNPAKTEYTQNATKLWLKALYDCLEDANEKARYFPNAGTGDYTLIMQGTVV